MSDYTTYPGKFPCRECKEEVKTLRMYPGSGEATWKCSKKHISKVQLFFVGYKKKKDYERKERE